MSPLTGSQVKDLDGDSKRILNTPRESHDASSDLEAADDDDDEVILGPHIRV